MFRIAGLLLGPRPTHMEVGYVPALNQIAQGDDSGEALKLSQALYRQQVGRLQCLFFAFELCFVRHLLGFICYGKTFTLFEVQEVPRLAAAESPIPQNFAFDDRLVSGPSD